MSGNDAMKLSRKNCPVVFAVDNNYFPMMFVAVCSLLHVDKKSEYKLIILMGENVSPTNQNLFDRLKQICDVSLLVINKEMLNGARVIIETTSIETYYRLLLPDLLSDYDSCIYLDCDVIVNNSIEELFSLDMNDTYVYGVRDFKFYEKHDMLISHFAKIGLGDNSEYINAGVLVMNLALMRKDSIQKNFYSKMHNIYPFQDQDILNLCCQEKISFLPLKFNYFSIYGMPRDGQKNISIIHYAGDVKPWFDRKSLFSDDWWKCAEKNLDNSILSVLKQKMEDKEKYDFDIMSPHKFKDTSLPVYIYGFTEFSKKVYDCFVSCKLLRIVGFIDNNPNKVGQIYNAAIVISYRNFLEIVGEKNVVILAQRRKTQLEVFELLQHTKGVREIKLLTKKNGYYFLFLKSEYCLKQLESICLLEGIPLDSAKEIFSCFEKGIEMPEKYFNLDKIYNLNEWFYRKKYKGNMI